MASTLNKYSFFVHLYIFALPENTLPFKSLGLQGQFNIFKRSLKTAFIRSKIQ